MKCIVEGTTETMLCHSIFLKYMLCVVS